MSSSRSGFDWCATRKVGIVKKENLPGLFRPELGNFNVEEQKHWTLQFRQMLDKISRNMLYVNKSAGELANLHLFRLGLPFVAEHCVLPVQNDFQKSRNPAIVLPFPVLNNQFFLSCLNIVGGLYNFVANPSPDLIDTFNSLYLPMVSQVNEGGNQLNGPVWVNGLPVQPAVPAVHVSNQPNGIPFGPLDQGYSQLFIATANIHEQNYLWNQDNFGTQVLKCYIEAIVKRGSGDVPNALINRRCKYFIHLAIMNLLTL